MFRGLIVVGLLLTSVGFGACEYKVESHFGIDQKVGQISIYSSINKIQLNTIFNKIKDLENEFSNLTIHQNLDKNLASQMNIIKISPFTSNEKGSLFFNSNKIEYKNLSDLKDQLSKVLKDC